MDWHHPDSESENPPHTVLQWTQVSAVANDVFALCAPPVQIRLRLIHQIRRALCKPKQLGFVLRTVQRRLFLGYWLGADFRVNKCPDIRPTQESATSKDAAAKIAKATPIWKVADLLWDRLQVEACEHEPARGELKLKQRKRWRY